jgi:hypothetical protein
MLAPEWARQPTLQKFSTPPTGGKETQMRYNNSNNFGTYAGAGLLGAAVAGLAYGLFSPSTSASNVDAVTSAYARDRLREKLRKLEEEAAATKQESKAGRR